jgi:hypothetical protein
VIILNLSLKIKELNSDVMLDFGNNVKVSFIKPETEQLLLMEPTCKFDPFSWLEDYKNLIDECLIKYDGVLLRNFGL